MDKNVWIPIDIPPLNAGTYLVNTANDKIILDRWDGETWGRCVPRTSMKGFSAGYPMHKGWTHLPKPMGEVTE